jgi:steroid delta-isomerase-like uncharacterized protein
MGQGQDTVQAFFDAFAAHDLEAAERLYVEDATITMPTGTNDLAGHKALGQVFLDAFPDAHMAVDLWLEVGETVVAEGRFVGTHDGDLVSPDGTIPATGNALTIPFLEIYRVVDGKITEQRTYWDQVSMMAQLGALPVG